MIWFLLVLFQVKHFVCDYLLQGRYMLGKFREYPYFILPLAAHAMVHVVATFIISVFFVSPTFAMMLAIMDGVIHFAVDRVKASPALLGRFTALSKNEMKSLLQMKPMPGSLGEDAKNKIIKSNQMFWHCLGLDQMAHHLTHYAIIALLMIGGA